jgi:hypothetical protein
VLESAAVMMELSDADGSSEVIAWSLLPQVAATPFEASHGYTLGPSLKLEGVDVSVGNITRQRVEHGEAVFLRAEDELTSRAGWKFHRTATVQLEGSYRLVMIVRAPAHGRPQLSVTLTASVRPPGVLPKRFRKLVDIRGPEGPNSTLAF